MRLTNSMEEEEEVRAGCVWLSLSLLRLAEEEDFVNCRLILITTSSQPVIHKRKSQGLVRRLRAACWLGVRCPLDSGDPTCEKTWGLKNSAHLSVSID